MRALPRLSPWLSPRVADDPVLVSGFFAPSDDGDDVVDALSTLRVDSTSVLFQVLGGVNTARNRSAGKDLSLHLVIPRAVSVLRHWKRASRARVKNGNEQRERQVIRRNLPTRRW